MKDKVVLFGAGNYGKKAMELLDKEQIAFFVDNDERKRGSSLQGIPVYIWSDIKDCIHTYPVIIAVSNQYEEQLIKQLQDNDITKYETFNEFKVRLTQKRIAQRADYIKIYNNAIQWILNNTIHGEGIICNSGKRKSYPEVTGYYIPTLIKWGYCDLAISYAKWLCKIQKEDGSWYDTDNCAPYVFDSAQILKGLIAVRELLPEVDENIKKGCKWILSNIEPSGRLSTPTKEAWGNGRACSELIHLYCLSPLIEAANIFQIEEYKEKAYKVLDYYKNNYYENIMQFSLLSHFYAYVMEALLDLGEVNMVQEAMHNIEKYQKKSGEVPAYHDVDWVCSTGLFQLALVWFRLGEITHGKRAFEYACKLQNPTGGWYGSYLSDNNAREENDYFPTEEISWAVKYFLDALYYKNLAEFEEMSDIFGDTIDISDGRYQVISNIVKELSDNMNICDVGCGKGRYIKNLLNVYPQHNYYVTDISKAVMQYVPNNVREKKQGTLTNIPYKDDSFDLVYTCEALEHCIDVESAVKELIRVTKTGGKIIIIDKNIEQLGTLLIGEWEQWFDVNQLKSKFIEKGHEVKVINNIHYENEEIRELFFAFIITKM